MKTESLRRECEEMNEAVKKKIAIGVEDFKEIIDKDGYFVDKTLMIKKLIESRAKVTLFTRPRRFGKTLNQFMIRRFFEAENSRVRRRDSFAPAAVSCDILELEVGETAELSRSI